MDDYDEEHEECNEELTQQGFKIQDLESHIKGLAKSLRDVLSYKRDWPPPLIIIRDAEEALRNTSEVE